MDTNNLVDYHDVADKMKPLDLLLFRGSDPFSGFIRFIQNNMQLDDEFSHAGLIVTREVLPQLTQLRHGVKYVWESTCSWAGVSDGTPDIISGSGKLGVQIRDLESVVRGYLKGEGSKIAWFSLKNNPYNVDKKRVERILKNIYTQFGAARYEAPLGLCAAVLPPLRKMRYVYGHVTTPEGEILIDLNQNFDGSRLFCSELVALIYQALDIIDCTLNPSDILPSHFVHMHIIETKTYLTITEKYEEGKRVFKTVNIQDMVVVKEKLDDSSINNN